MSTALKNKIKKLKLLILDVDGVLTNGEIVYDDMGKELKVFNVMDGFGIVFFQKLGYKTGIISARASKAVKARAKDLKISEVRLNAYPKLNVYKQVLKKLKLKNDQVGFIGDDLPDLAVLKEVGFAVAVKNACPEVKKVADYIAKKEGGEGAVREVIELIIKTNGQWNKLLKQFGGK